MRDEPLANYTRWKIGGPAPAYARASSEDELRALVVLDRGSPFVVGQIEQDRRAISEEYARRSYLDARISQEVTRDDERRLVAIDYTITEREQATIASIDIEGDEKIREFVIARELNVGEAHLGFPRYSASLEQTGGRPQCINALGRSRVSGDACD